MKTLACGPLLVLVLLLAGCTSLDLNLGDFGKPVDQTASVSEIVCLWEPAEGVGLDRLPTRGFAGQILFFVKGQSEPVRVSGDVRIYVFDDQGTSDEQARPLHEFNFPADVWNTYLTRTNLGSAYQLFIPYTRRGGNFANCEIRVRLTAQDRLPIYSKMASIALPGRRQNPGAMQQVGETVATALPGGELQSLTEQAAVQRLSAQLGGGRTQQFDRLHQAAANAVQTADYTREQTAETGTATSADFETEQPPSRRYRMSPAGESR